MHFKNLHYIYIYQRLYISHLLHQFSSHLQDLRLCTKIPFDINTLINLPQESQNTGAWQECLFRNQTISLVGGRREGDDIGWGLIRRAAQPFSTTASQGRESRENTSEKGAQSRAANEHPRTQPPRRQSRPVDDGRKSRSQMDERERDEGAADAGTWTRWSTWTAVADRHEDGTGESEGRGSACRSERACFVSVVRCFRGIGQKPRVSRCHWAPRGGRARERNHTRFFVPIVSMRAALDPCVIVFA